MGYIYKITNKINGLVYVGQTTQTPKHRWIHHLTDSRTGSECKLHKALREFGKENFVQETIEEVPDSFLDEREVYWIKYYNSYYKGYNGTEGTTAPPGTDIVVICLDTGIVYPSSAEASNQTGINRVHIAECARNAPKRATAGGLHWMQWEDYCDKGPTYRKLGNELNSKSVICVETGKVYKSVLEASKATGIPRVTITKICRNLNKGPVKFHWRYNDNK